MGVAFMFFGVGSIVLEIGGDKVIGLEESLEIPFLTLEILGVLGFISSLGS